MRTSVMVLLIVLAGMVSGCANLAKNAGSVVESKEAIGRQEPWHNLAIVGSVRQTEAISVAYVALPSPIPKEWKEDFVDPKRIYTVSASDGKKARKPLERVVFRALAYRDEEVVALFDAVLNPSLTGFFVLLPADGRPYMGLNLVIVPSHANWLMTLSGEIVMIPERRMFAKLPQGFFVKHPSMLRQVIPIGRSDPNGRKLLVHLEQLFPKEFMVHGVRYAGRPDVKVVMGEFTKVDHPLDRLISCGSLTVSPSMGIIGLGISGIRNASVMSQDDCYQ